MFESISDFFSSGWNTVKESASGVSASWGESVSDLKVKATEFMTLFSRLKAIQSNPGLSAGEKSKVDAILKRGEVVKATVTALTKSIDGIANVLPKNMLSGMASRGQLGVLPLIPIAAIASAIAAMTMWISDAYVELERLELAEKVRVSGGDPASVLGGAKINWWLVGGGVVVVGGLIYLVSRPRSK